MLNKCIVFFEQESSDRLLSLQRQGCFKPVQENLIS
jgi:hypothetical protein